LSTVKTFSISSIISGHYRLTLAISELKVEKWPLNGCYCCCRPWIMCAAEKHHRSTWSRDTTNKSTQS